MLEILKQDNKESYKDIIAELNIPLSAAQVSEAMDNGNVTGYGIYEFSENSILIHKIAPENDLLLFDGIARSVMFLAVLKGIERAEFGESLIKNARLLKYINMDSTVLEPISSIFNGCEHCRHNKAKPD